MLLSEECIKEIFQKSGAILKGHFKLSSGFHSDTYIQCAFINQNPQYNTLFCGIIAEKFKNKNIDIVIGPALGGIIIAYEVAKQLQAKVFFTERDAEKKMSLRRGFEIKKGEKVLVVEDVITTGGSVKEVIELVRQNEGEVVGLAAFINRTGDKNFYLVENQFFLLNIDAVKYNPSECPLCKNNVPISTPGSRYI